MPGESRLRESYDWIVLGDSPAAILSAALVAKMGLSVLLVGDGPEKKWTLSSSGQVIDPEPNFISGLSLSGPRSGLARKCLEHLRLADSEWAILSPERAAFQAITPSIRAGFEFSWQSLSREVQREESGLSGFVSELIRVMESNSEAIHGYWRQLPQRLTLAAASAAEQTVEKREDLSKVNFTSESQIYRELSRELTRMNLDRAWSDLTGDFRNLGASQKDLEWLEAWLAGALCSENPKKVSAYELLQALVLAHDGARCRGGMSGLRQLLYRVAARSGAQVAGPGVGVSRVFVEERRIQGVQLIGAEDSRNLTQARGVFTSRHPESVLTWISSEREQSRPYPTSCELLRVTIALAAKSEGIPVGLSERAIWREFGAPILEIERADPGEYGFLNTGNQFIFIRSYFPMEAIHWPTHRWKTVCQRMYRQACELIPFLEENVVRIFPDFRQQEFEAEWTSYYSQMELKRVEAFRAPVNVPGTPFLPQIEGLFYGHRSIAPAMGWMGEWAACLNATAWIAHRSGISGPLG
ncbi:MAG: hypothetical protein KGQ59_06815 [Bdellovibrionales bacterium]|nr:hypothetical protein [Bdellovibrionales bacterium]